MAAKKKDPLAQAVRQTVAGKGYKQTGQPSKAGLKAADKAIQEYKVQRNARLTDFLTDYWDADSDSFSSITNMADPEHPEYDPDSYNQILQSSGLEPEDLEDLGLTQTEAVGSRRDIAAGTAEDLGDYADIEDMETSDLAGGLTGSAVSEILGRESRGDGVRRSRGRTITGLEEGGGAARASTPARAPQSNAPTSSRRSTAIPRLKTVKEITEEQKFWAGETRSGKPERPYVQNQALRVEDAGTDLGMAAITATPEAKEAREQNKVRRAVGTINELVARENATLGVERGSRDSMTIPVEGGGAGSQPAQAATPAVTPPTPGRIIRSSNAAGRAPADRGGAPGVPLGVVTGASNLDQPPAPVPGRPAGPRRTRINRVPSGDTATGAVNPSGMSSQLQGYLRSSGMGGVIGAGSRSGGAMIKGADAVTRRMGGEALGAVVGSWDRDVEGNLVDLDNPATQVRETDSGAFELVNPLKEVRDPMDPDYVPYANSPKIPIRDISGPEGEAAVKKLQKEKLVKGKIASLTGRRPSRRRDPLPGPTVMEQTSTEQYGSDIVDLARKHGVSNATAARVVAAASELDKRKTRTISEGNEAVVTSGEELNILRAKPGTTTAVRGQMMDVGLAGGGTGRFKTNVPTAEELVSMFPPKEGETGEGGKPTPAYAERIASTYIIPKREILTPEQMAQRTADKAAEKKAARQKGMPKPPSKAQAAKDRKLRDAAIARDEAPRQAYKALREGPNAEDQYDTPGFIRAQEDLPYSSTTGFSTSVPRPNEFNASKNIGFLNQMIGADVEQFDIDRESVTNPRIQGRSTVTGDLISPSSNRSDNERYVYRGPSGNITANPTANPYFKNMNDNQFRGYRSQASDLASGAPLTGPAPRGQSPEQRMENIRRADAAVAGRRAGGLGRMPLAGEGLTDMARRVAGSAGPALRQVGRSMKSQRKAERKGLVSGSQFGQPQTEPSTDVG